MSDLATAVGATGAAGSDPYATALTDMQKSQADSLKNQAAMTKMNAEFSAQSNILSMQSAMREKMNAIFSQQIRSLSQ